MSSAVAGPQGRRRRAAGAGLVKAMAARCPSTRRGLRDRAVVLLGFAGAFRRSELAALDCSDIAEEADGLRVTIRSSKTDREGRFTAIMYSVVGTLSMNGIDVLRWLEAWLEACAKNGRKPPDDMSPWLPWSMSEDRRRELMAPG